MQETGISTLTAFLGSLFAMFAGAAAVVAFIRQPLVKRLGELKQDNRLHFAERSVIEKRLIVLETRMSNGVIEDIRELRAEVKALTGKVDTLIQQMTTTLKLGDHGA